MKKDFSDLPKRISTAILLLVIAAPAIIFKPTYPMFFNVLGALVTLIVIVETCVLYRRRAPAAHANIGRIRLLGLTITIISIGGIISLATSDLFTVILIVLSAFGYDIFALLVGKAFGRHKLCPSISEKKTWQGFLGGVMLSSVLCVSYISVLLHHGISLNRFHHGIFVVCGGFIACAADLLGSLYKRLVIAKDSSQLLPGHGGFLDRFLSLFAVALTYFALSTLAFLSN